jgi:GntR family transcriptional regulator
MNIVIENTSDKPIYQQLFEQISGQILRGELKKDFSLPPIRTAAKELRISIITVKKAWEALEREGFIYTMAGKGCFVNEMSKDKALELRNDLAKKQLSKEIQYYKALGLSLDELIELIKKEY